MAQVSIVMGSDSDMPVMAKAAEILDKDVYKRQLTDSQWEDLEQRAQQVSEEYQCGVYMITVDDYTDYSLSLIHI